MRSVTSPRFIQIHWLTSYPGVLLNRDDSGIAKRLEFGGAVRTRISSQCLKRHWRGVGNDGGISSIGAETSVRSRRTFETLLFEPMVKAGVEREVAATLVSRLKGSLLKDDNGAGEDSPKGSKKRKEKPVEDEKEYGLRTSQALLLGYPEIEYLRSELMSLAKEAGTSADRAEQLFKSRFDGKNGKELSRNLLALKNGAGIDSALFGRMVTGDLFANRDAALHVAHAFTVHEEEVDQDYFTVVDDLRDRNDPDDAGAAGIFDTELTSGLFYGYAVIDVALLISNVTGCSPERSFSEDVDRDIPAKVASWVLQRIATVSPGAKKGSTAPYSYAEFLLAEVGVRQPRTLANAFRDPLEFNNRSGELLLTRACNRLQEALSEFDRLYEPHEVRRAAGTKECGFPGAHTISVLQLAGWLEGAVRDGREVQS